MIQDLFVHAYYKLIGDSKLLKPIRFAVRTSANLILKFAFRFRTTKYRCSDREGDVIISLTSFPPRIQNIWITIETLLRQSVKARKIILWLSKEQFKPDDLPSSLVKLQSRGLELRFVDGDYRSHKKYFYTFKEYPDDLILLVDDDIIYPSDLIESLLKVRREAGNNKIISHKYGGKMKYDAEGNLMPYNTWGCIHTRCEGRDLFFGSGGGTLLCPHDLYPDVSDIDLVMKLCPQADDIWLNAMAKLGGCSYIKIQGSPILSIQYKEDQPLYKSNVWNNKNDIQLANVVEYYTKALNINPFSK